MSNLESAKILADAPKIDNFEIIELLGKGGMSLVYKARQMQLDRIVAVKVLSRNACAGEIGLKRFQNEAKLTSMLAHPNIVKTIAFGISTDGQAYLVMEYLQGCSLAEELKANGRLTLQRFHDIFLAVLGALEKAHSEGMIHRDLKPGNIMLCQTDNGTETVKLVDFGIAKIFDEGNKKGAALTATGSVLGSPAYMSPEQCNSQPMDHRSDLYSLSCVMYESLCGEPPFSADSILELMRKHSTESPPTEETLRQKIAVNKTLAEVLVWGLAKDPDSRPQSACEFAKRLKEALENKSLEQVPELKQPGVSWKQTIKQKPIIVVTGILCCSLMIPFMFADKSKPESKTVAGTLQSHSQRLESQRQKKTLAGRLMKEKEWHQAEVLLKECMENSEAGKEEQTDYLADLARCYSEQKNFKEAMLLYKQLAETDKPPLAQGRKNLFQYMEQEANCLRNLEEWDKAGSLYLRLIQIGEREKGEHYRKPLRNCINQLAICYEHSEKWLQAVDSLERLVAMEENEKNYDKKEIAGYIGRLAHDYLRLDKYKKGFDEYKKLFEIRKSLGEAIDDNDLLFAGYCCQQLGQIKEAEKYFRRALSHREKKTLASDDKKTLKGLEMLAYNLFCQNKGAEAEVVYKRVMALSKDRTRIFVILDHLGDCACLQRKFEEEANWRKQSLALREKTLGPNAAEIAFRLVQIATACARSGKDSEAENLITKAATIAEKSSSADPNRQSASFALASWYTKYEHFPEAEAQIKAVLSNKIGLAANTYDFELLKLLTMCYRRQHKIGEAELLAGKNNEKLKEGMKIPSI